MSNPIEFKPPYLMVICGRQGSGKSHLINWLMRENSLSDTAFDYGIVITNTAFEGSFPYIPQKYIFETFNPETVENLMNIQKKNVEKGIHKQAFILFDDALDDPEQWTSPCIKRLTTQLRHYDISIIISTQYPHLVPPRVRANCMYSLFFDIGAGRREMDAIYNAYGGHFDNFQQFKAFYYNNVKDHKFVLYDKESDTYKTYKCPPEIPKFQLKYNRKVTGKRKSK